MRRLLSASFRNRLFAALLAASLIPLLLCSALLLQIFRLRMEDRAQGEADGYLDSVGQTLDQACRSFSSAAAALERDSVLPRRSLALSRGTVDQLYLAVRLAICELVLPPEKQVPIVLDDALANFDDGRCALALEALARLGEERQILLFTCHSREARLAEGREGAAVLRLQS